MPKVTNAQTSYTAVGNREDLSDVIYNISPFETPIMSMVDRRNVSNRTFDWQTMALPTVSTAGEVEGFTATNAAATATVRQTNVTMILTRNASVSGTEEKITSAGRKSDMALQVATMSKALKRDLESAISQNAAQNNGVDDTTARVTRGLEHWIQTNRSSGVSYAYTNPTTAMTDGTQRAFTETLLKAAVLSTYTNGGDPSVLVLPPAQKQVFSGFAGRTGAQIRADAKIVAGADYYLSDFGELKVVPSRFMRARTALILTPDMLKIAYLRPFMIKDLPVNGDAESKMVLVEAGLECSNEAAHGKVSDLT